MSGLDERSRRLLARLRSQVAIRDSQIMANPLPYLIEAEKQLIEMRICMEDIQRALSPDAVFDFAEDHCIKPADINGEAYIRVKAAQKVLDKWLFGT